MKKVLLVGVLLLVACESAGGYTDSSEVLALPSVKLEGDGSIVSEVVVAEPGECEVEGWQGPLIGHHVGDFSIVVDMKLKNLSYEYFGMVLSLLEGPQQVEVSLRDETQVTYLACDNGDGYRLYCRSSQELEYDQRKLNVPSMLVSALKIRHWKGFYCIDTDCASRLGYWVENNLLEGEPVGCPTWVTYIVGLKHDSSTNSNKSETRAVYLDIDSCEVHNQ